MRVTTTYKWMIAALCAVAVRQATALTLDEGFQTPPRSARPHTWYHMMNGNVTKEGITCDFEALAKAGIGGVQMFDAGCAIPPGPLKFNTPDWFDLFAHAQKEAKRLGLEICIPNCSGWSSSGGPWNPPANGMKVVTLTETVVKGGATFSGRLPRTEKDNGFYEDIAVLAYPTPAKGGEIPDLNRKIFRSADQKNSPLSRSGGFPWSLGFKTAPSTDQIVAPADVVDLTERMSGDGTLVWTAPAGRDWTVLRIGYACNGRCNHPASEKGRGLEVDKLSAAAMDFHFDQYVSRLCRTLGITDRTDNTLGFNNILVDSYEVDSQNWTQGFDRTFERRMGYPIRPYLPVFAGHVVGSVETTERFLEDFRRVVADLFAENYAGRLAELCHRHGLKLSLEPYGNCPADDLQYGEAADVPMAEFWSQAFMGDNRCSDTGNSRHAAHVAHVWGRRYAATESFTAHPGPGGRWYTTPFSIKSQGDRVFAEGVNRIIYHRFTHQPWPGNQYVPGLTMGRWGMHLDRTQTWWPLANDWFAYQARCQWMLQEGLFAADVLYWSGEAVPNNNVVNTRLPAGYNWDVCATAAFLRLRVENGKVVVPGGVRYSLLVLPETDTMSERALRKVAELLRAGAKICAVRRPTRAPGLKGLDSESVRKLVAETWSLGVLEGDAGDALAKLGLKPDVEIGTDPASWIHRTSADADWYFVATDNPTPVAFEASFRQSGRVPEIWEPLTGERRDAPVWREEDGRTVVAFRFPPSGSAFVVFRRASGTETHVASVRTMSRPLDVAAERHTLEIRAAEYGAIKSGETRPAQPFADLTEKLRGLVRDGTLVVTVNNGLAGRDPAPKVRKAMCITFVLDGVECTEIYDENSVCMIPRLANVHQPPPEWDWRDGTIIAWKPETFTVSRADGTMQTLSAAPAAPIEVKGAWQVAFPPGWDAPASVTFPELLPWNEHQDDGVKYFSGTATYTRSVAFPALKKGVRVMLDLGEVRNFAEVKVNGRTFPVLWKPPFRLDVTDALKAGDTSFELEVKVTNLWANRLIGDDRLYAPDCEWKGCSHRGKKEIPICRIPDWVKEGRRSPTGRHTFTTWQHWSKEDDLLPSGLIGPVTLRFGESAVPASMGTFDIADNGAKTGGDAVNTAAIQRTIDACAQAGGGWVVVPRGVYRTGALFFKPGVKLRLDEGAVLLGSDDGADYPQCETRIEGETCRYYPAMINADRCDGFAIEGRGTIDGHGFGTWEEFRRRLAEIKKRTGNTDSFRNKDMMRPRVLYVSNSRNVDISGVTFKNSKFWTTHFYQCEDVLVHDCAIIAEITRDSRGRELRGPSTDAVDIDKCRNFTVRGCRISVNDDGVVVKGGKGAWANDYVRHPENGPSSNILVEDCLFQSPTHHCLTLGSECPEAHGVVMRNCRMEGVGAMLYLKMRTDTPQHYSDALVENVTGNCGDFVKVTAWTQYADFGGRTPLELKSYATNVVIRNCRVTCRKIRNIRENSEVFELDGLKLENNEIRTGTSVGD